MNIFNFIQNFSFNKSKTLNEKNDNELTLEDRLYHLELTNDNQTIIKQILNLKNNENKINVNNRVYNDLEFFTSNMSIKSENNEDKVDYNKTIYSKLNNTKTAMGDIILKNIIENPINNIDLLKKRQSLLKNYINLDNNNKDIINKTLQNIKYLEKDLKWFWDQNVQKHLHVMYDLVYLNLTGINKIDNWFNENKILLSIFNIYRIFISPIINILSPLSAVIIPFVLFLTFKKFLPIKIDNKQFIKFVLSNVFNSNIVSIFSSGISLKKKIFGIVSAVLWIFFYLQNIYSSIKLSKNIHKIINLIHTKLNSVYNLIDNCNILIEKCNNLNLKILDIDLDNVFNNISKFKNIFNNKCLNCSPSLFSNKGIILSTYQIFNNFKNNIQNILKYIGLIDYLNSNHLLINKYNNKNIYSFTNYKNKSKPYFKFKKIWNPYIDDNPICNNIKIKKNIILTGPNAAGKSTFIKSVAINIILSQTIGISSSQNCVLTPIHILDTYLHIPDIKGNSSLFEAEMKRSKDYISKLKKNNKPSFIIMDEIFSSTNYIEGFSGAYAILNKISSFNKSLFIVTTHYNKLSQLENKKITNYKFDIKKDLSNNITFNYKLKKGVCDQFIALDLLKKNNFDNEIIEEALNISNNIKLSHK